MECSKISSYSSTNFWVIEIEYTWIHQYWWWWCYPTPSEGWGRGRTPRRPNSRSTSQGLDHKSSKMDEVEPKMARRRGSDARQSRRSEFDPANVCPKAVPAPFTRGGPKWWNNFPKGFDHSVTPNRLEHQYSYLYSKVEFPTPSLVLVFPDHFRSMGCGETSRRTSSRAHPGSKPEVNGTKLH